MLQFLMFLVCAHESVRINDVQWVILTFKRKKPKSDVTNIVKILNLQNDPTKSE